MQTAHPMRYAQRFANHPKILAALADRKPAEQYGAADLLRRLNLILVGDHYRKNFFTYIPLELLRQWFRVTPSTKQLETLNEEKLLPTPNILEYVRTPGQDVKSLRKYLSNGGFNNADMLHIELAYSQYTQNSLVVSLALQQRTTLSLDKFATLPNLDTDSIAQKEMITIDALVNEALVVFEHVQSQKKNRPLLVIGNKRYGSRFVIEPLEDALVQAGAKVVHEYVSSFYLDNDPTCIGRLSATTWEYIAQYSPDIFVVDGTKSSGTKRKKRFAAATAGYINAFKAYNNTIRHHVEREPYTIKLWAKDLTTDVVIGKQEISLGVNGELTQDLQGPQVTMISAASDSQAVFDDLEEYIINLHPGFSATGFCCRPIARDEHLFALEIQRVMKEKIAAHTSSSTRV